MADRHHQALRVLDGTYVIERPSSTPRSFVETELLALIVGPDGPTLIRRNDAAPSAWSALWNGDEAHDVESTGMLNAVTAPLAAHDIPVWVASSYDGDLVLVPTDRFGEASNALTEAGHRLLK